MRYTAPVRGPHDPVRGVLRQHRGAAPGSQLLGQDPTGHPQLALESGRE